VKTASGSANFEQCCPERRPCFWGDTRLWYKIAEANRLTGGESLVAGASLIIPNKVAIDFRETSALASPTFEGIFR
jgi:hypothetical protein